MGLNPNRGKKMGKNSMGVGDLEKFRCFFNFKKIITRSIFVVDKKVSEHQFPLKKKLIWGYKFDAGDY